MKGVDILTVTVISEIKAGVYILLTALILPVTIRNTKLFVTKHEMEVILLGREFLDKLGFNFTTYLKTSYHKIKDLDLEENIVKNDQLNSYSGVTYGNTDDDPILPRSIYQNNLATTTQNTSLNS